MMWFLGVSLVPLRWTVDVFPILKHLPAGFPGAQCFQSTASECKSVINVVTNAPVAFVKKQMSLGIHRPSFVSALIEKNSSINGTLTKANDDYIKLSAAVMYAGGSETTVSVISSTILALLLHPQVQKQAQQELDDVLGPAVMPTLQDRERLPYVAALVKESFRWMPVSPIGSAHVTTEEIVHRGYRIPKGSYLLPQIWWFLHDPEVYHDPEQFEPTRFLSPRNEPDPSRDAFGYGRRVCPGRYLAQDSVFLTVARVLAVFDIGRLRDIHGAVVEFEIQKSPGLFCRLGDFPYTIRPRSKKHAELIQDFETAHPWGPGDASSLDQQVHEMAKPPTVPV